MLERYAMQRKEHQIPDFMRNVQCEVANKRFSFAPYFFSLSGFVFLIKTEIIFNELEKQLSTRESVESVVRWFSYFSLLIKLSPNEILILVYFSGKRLKDVYSGGEVEIQSSEIKPMENGSNPKFKEEK